MIFYTWMDDWIEVHIIFHFNKKVLEADDDGDVGPGCWINWLQDILEVCQLLLNMLAVLSYCMLNWQPQLKCNPTKICFLCPITSPHHCCSQLHPCSVFFSHVFVFVLCIILCHLCPSGCSPMVAQHHGKPEHRCTSLESMNSQALKPQKMESGLEDSRPTSPSGPLQVWTGGQNTERHPPFE